MGRPKVNHRTLAYRKRILSRKRKTRKVDIVSRKTQPQIRAEVQALKKQDVALSRVSSSWIAALGYIKSRKVVTMNLISGHTYHILGVSFKVFEEWYNAHSKGTFWHVKNIKDNYKVVRIR